MFNFIHHNINYKELSLAATCSSINKLLITLPEFFLGFAIDVVVHEQKPALVAWGLQTNIQQLIFFAACVTVVWLVSSLFYFLEIRSWQTCAQTLQHNVRLRLYNHIQQLDLTNENTGNVVAMVNDDVNNIEQFLRFSAHDTIHLAVGSLIITSIYCYYCPLVALVALLPLPLVVLLSFKFHQRLQCNYLMLRNQAGKLATHITDALTKKTFDDLELEKESLLYKQTALDVAQTNALFNPTICMILGLGTVGTLIISGSYALHGYISTGIFSMIFLQTQRLLWPFARMPQLIDAYESTMASLQRVAHLLQTAPKETAASVYPEKPQQKEL